MFLNANHDVVLGLMWINRYKVKLYRNCMVFDIAGYFKLIIYDDGLTG